MQPQFICNPITGQKQFGMHAWQSKQNSLHYDFMSVAFETPRRDFDRELID